jgi:hypothetical protein
MKSRSVLRSRWTTGVALAACVVLSSSCVRHSGSRVELGLKRVAVNLAFKDASKAKPPTYQQVIQTPQLSGVTAGAFAGLQDDGQVIGLAPPITADVLFKCPKAAAGERPDSLSPGTINSPPAKGTFIRHNNGTFKATLGALSLAGPYQLLSAMDINNIVVTPPTQGSVLVASTPPTIDFDVLDRTAVQTVTTSYHVTATQLQLTKITTKVGQTVTTFQPVPAVEIYGFNAASSWTSGGIDPNTGTAMVVQGSLAGEELVDVCGHVYDAYKVVSSERIVNPQTGYDYETDTNDPKVYWFANQFGGLLLQLHENSHTVATVMVNGAPVPITVDVNNTGTVTSVNASPLGTSPPFG